VREAVRELGKKHTVLFSTHILSEAEQVCDRVVIINKGRIVAQGAPAKLRQQLQPGTHLYVQIGGISTTRVQQLLESIPGVSEVRKQGEGYAVRAQDDIRGEVSAKSAEIGARLLELRPIAMTLEDIFLDIVGKGETV
jgi:ABC-2 type transport system ATP-binding protein